MCLARAPDKINIAKLVRLTENDLALVAFFHPDHKRCPLPPVCSLRGVRGKALSDLMQPRAGQMKRNHLPRLAGN